MKKGFAKRKKIVDSMCEAPFVQGRDGLVVVITTVVRSIVARRHIIEKERPEDSIPAGGDYFSGLGGVYKQMMEKRKVIHGPTTSSSSSSGAAGGAATEKAWGAHSRMGSSYDEEEEGKEEEIGGDDDEDEQEEEEDDNDESDKKDVEGTMMTSSSCGAGVLGDRSGDGEVIGFCRTPSGGGSISLIRREQQQRKRTHPSTTDDKREQEPGCSGEEIIEKNKSDSGIYHDDDRGGQREDLHKEGKKRRSEASAAGQQLSSSLNSSATGAPGASSSTSTGWRKAWRTVGGGMSSTADDSNPLVGVVDRGMPTSFLMGTAASRGDRFLQTGHSSGSSLVSSMSTTTSLSSLPPHPLPAAQHAAYFPSGLLPQQNSSAAVAAPLSSSGTLSAAILAGHPTLLTAGLPFPGPGNAAVAVPLPLYSEGALLAREFGFPTTTSLLAGSGSSAQHNLLPPFYRAVAEVGEGGFPGPRSAYYPLLSSSALNPGINLGEYGGRNHAIDVYLPMEVNPRQQQGSGAVASSFPPSSSDDGRLRIPNLSSILCAPPGSVEDSSSWAREESTTDDGSDRASVSAASSRSDFPPPTTDDSCRSNAAAAAIMDKMMLPSFVHLGKYPVRPGKSPGPWCKPGCVVGLYVDGIGEAFPSAALALGVVVDQTDTPFTADTTAATSGDRRSDSATTLQLTVALQGEVTVVFPSHRSADMLRFWKGGKNDYLCVDARGNVGFWDQKSTESRVFGIALWQQTEFTAEGLTRGLRVMLFPQVDAVLPIRLEFQRMVKQLQQQDSDHSERRRSNHRQSLLSQSIPTPATENRDERSSYSSSLVLDEATGAFKSASAVAANESTKSDITSSRSSFSQEELGEVKVASAIGPGSAEGSSSSLPSV